MSKFIQVSHAAAEEQLSKILDKPPSIEERMARFTESVRLQEHGVKGMKWGQRKQDNRQADSSKKTTHGTPSVTILMGTNGSGKSTLMKNLVARYGAGETNIGKERWSLIDRHGEKALIMGNYEPRNKGEYLSSGKYLQRGNFWDMLRQAVDKAKEIGAKGVIVDSKRFAYGKQHDSMMKFAKDEGFRLKAARVKTPPEVAQSRIKNRRDQHVKTHYSMTNLISQNRWADDHFDKHPEENRILLKNDNSTNMRMKAKQFAKFVLKD